MNRKRAVRKKKINRGTAMLLMVVFVVALFSLSIYERSCLIALDTEIRHLEEQYTASVRYNDDLQAKLLSSGSISEIENYAVGVLGMVKPDSASISYVVYSKDGPSGVTNAQSGSWLGAWFSGLFGD